MRQFPSRVGSIALVALVSVLVIALVGSAGVVSRQLLSPSNIVVDPLGDAWEKARAAGSYRFDGDVVQVTLPSAIPANVGRSSHDDQYHLQGLSNLRLKSLEMELWTQGGSVAQAETGVGVKVENGKTYRRQNTGEWKEDTGISIDGIAPQGDFLAFLKAVRNVTSHETETRAGLTFRRYTFEMDGPAFALMVRDQMEASMRQKGELPPGIELTIPNYYREMTGQGELWVHVGGIKDGLPLRQILTLSFPEQRHESVQAQIKINFLDYGQPDAPTGLMGFVAAIRDQLPSLPGIVLPLLALLGIVLLFRFHTAQRLQRGMAVTLVLSMVLGPALSGIKTGTFLDAQFARAAAQEKQAKEADTAESLREINKTEKFDPHQSPISTAEQRAILETRIANVGLNVGISAPAAQVLPTDNGTDTDVDNLTDFAEARVGTSEVISDTDGDGILDGVEVRGFSMGGKMWYLDANAIDSNGDGIGDGQECWVSPPANMSQSCDLDTDSDGTPDALDSDNDNDGVPDRLDLAAFTQSGATAFTYDSPLKLTLSHLTANVPVIVDFQLRPSDVTHLAYAFNVLDWPHDDKAQIQDIDNKTWADVARAQSRVPAANESFGDLKLIPMLEIRVPASSGTPTNLPPQSDLIPYNITVNDYVAGGATKIVYVPLSIQTDEKTGMRAAFTGRMRYLPSGNWPAPHDVRLAWVVQGLVDIPCDASAANAAQIGCASDGYIHNQPQVIHSYSDDWRLTGLNVSESHGTQSAIIYEDPTVDTDKKADTALVGLATGLDNVFLSGRDADNNSQRDITIPEIVNRFHHTTNSGYTSDQRWGLTNTLTTTNNILNVERHDYPTFDQAVMFTAMSETVGVLSSKFGSFWTSDNTLKPSLMFVYENKSRAMSLDGIRAGVGYAAFSGSNLTVDMQPSGQPQVPLNTLAGMKWSHYCKADAATAWAICDSEVYWNELDSRLANTPVFSGDPVDTNVDAGRRFITHAYDLVLSEGVNRTVQQDSVLISSRYSLKSDSDMAINVRAGLLGTGTAIAALANIVVLARVVDKITVVQELGKTLKGVTGGLNNLFRETLGLGQGRLGTTVMVGAAIAVVAGLAAAIYFAADGNVGGQIALKSVVVVLQIVLSIYLPISAASALPGGLAANLGSRAELIGNTKTAGAIGAAIGIAITWGFFIYSMVSNRVSAFSPEFNAALAETIAATIYIVLLAVLAATIVGAILVGIITVIDAILTAVCELGVDDLRKVPGLGGACFTLGTSVVKAIAYFLYNYELMIDTSRKDMVQPGSPKTLLADPNKGISAGNVLTITMPITTNISHKSPGVANGIYINFYLWLFSKNNLRSSTFKYTVTQPNQEDLTNVERDQMTNAWQNVGEHHKYALTPMYGGNAVITPPGAQFSNTVAGLNQSMPFYLNMGYALPAYECWAVPLLPFFWPIIPICYTRTFKGNSSSKIDTLQYDVFPATLNDFMALGAKPDGGRGQSWVAAFPSLKDADGDGLMAIGHGGLDPNDATWDTDNDGLSDANELDRRARGGLYSPVTCDTDSDGLTDGQEAALGTNPSLFDSDNDGLSDSEEVWHQVYVNCAPSNTWTGGWDVPINATTPFTTHVSSDPLKADADGDGINDLAEKQLATNANLAARVDKQNRPYHPSLFNSSPIVIYNQVSPRFVRPGQSFFYTTTVASTAALAPSVLDIKAPSAITGSVPPVALPFNSLTFNSAQTVTQQVTLTVKPGLSTQQLTFSNTVRARLASSGPVTYTWDSAALQTLDTLAGSPAQYGSLVVPMPGSQDAYRLGVMTSNAGNQTRGGAGNILTYTIPSGQSRIIDDGTNPPATRGSNAATSACNKFGICLMAWDQLQTTGATPDSLKAVLLNMDGSFIKTVPLTTPTAILNDNHYFAPVVGSDGTNFVVVHEVAGYTSQAGSRVTMLVAQHFDQNGNFKGLASYSFHSYAGATSPPPANRASLKMAVVWNGARYFVAIEERQPTSPSINDFLQFSEIEVMTDSTVSHYQSIPYALSGNANTADVNPPALAYDPNTGQTLLVRVDNSNSVHYTVFPAGYRPTGGAVSDTGVLGTGGAVSAAYNPMLKAWLISVDGQITLLNLDGSTFINTVGSPGTTGSSTLACPAPESEPALNLRFEDAPQSTTFVNSSNLISNAVCASSSTCPAGGIPGATDAGGLAVGTPASDYGMSFDGIDDTLVVSSPVVPGQDGFSVAFWYSSTQVQTSTVPISIGAARLFVNNDTLVFRVGDRTLTFRYNFSIADGRWHYIAATHNGRLTDYTAFEATVDGMSAHFGAAVAASAIEPYEPNITIGGQTGGLRFIDEFQVYKAALHYTVFGAKYNRTQQSYCASALTSGADVKWGKVNLRASDPRGGKITSSGGGISITVDADVPTSTIVGLTNGQYLAGNTSTIIGGNASDSTSGIATVELNVNNTGFQAVNGSATWAYNLTLTESTYTLQTRATDLAGNVETPAAAITVIADATAPNVTLNALPSAVTAPIKNANGRWVVGFSGTVSDPMIGALAGSGVAPGSVEVQIEGSAGNAQGNGWQTATLSSNGGSVPTWSISYTLPTGLPDPTGTYSVSVRAADAVGNRTSDADATGVFRLDGAGPTASLSDANSARSVISTTLAMALSGVVSDTGEVGLDSLEVAFTSVDDILALPETASPDDAAALLNRTWLPATLAQRGAGVTQTTWSITVPSGLENMFQIDLRGRDLLGNSLITSNVWRGVIDNLDPRVSMTATLTGNSYFDESLQKRRYEVQYACVAQDQYLDDATFQCPGNAIQPPTRILTSQVALERLFPDLILRTGMVNTYTLWQTATIPAAQMQVCDGFDHCAVAQSPAISQDVSGNQLMRVQAALTPLAAKPVALVIAPTQGSYVAAGSSGSISVTVAAESDQPLKEIAILLDGTQVATLPFAQADGMTQTQRTVAVLAGGEGLHTVSARATDWANTVQSSTMPITFTLDTQLPAVTLDTSTLTVSDTWQLESGVLRFRGTATDSVGLAAVQLKVNDLPFADAVFKNGEWQTALPLTDPEGKTLSVTVRAIDFAGQRTTFSQLVGTDLSSADAPDTQITANPANPSNVTSASIVFTGTSATDEVVAFDCQIDEDVFLPCVSPLSLADLSNGDHTVNVRAIDSQGHADLTPASATWTIDVAALKTTLTAGPAANTTDRAASFVFTGAAGTTSFECALDTSVFTVCTSPLSLVNLSPGQHIFQVRAKDGGSNTGAATRVVWTVLNAVPLASSQSISTSENKAVGIALMADDTDADALLFAVDPPGHGVLQGIPPDMTYTPDSSFVGIDKFTFRASDAVDSSNVATVTIVVSDDDIVPPVSAITLTSALTTAQPGLFVSPVHVVVSATDGIDSKATGVAETRCVLNPAVPPAAFADLAPGCAYLGGGADVSANGDYTLYAASRDNANNAETPISQTFRLDSTLDDDVIAPVSAIAFTPATPTGQNGWYIGPVRVEASATDGTDSKATGVAETRCVLDPAAPPATFADLPAGCAYLGAGTGVVTDGLHTVFVASRDNAGNQETPISRTLPIDQSPPTVHVAGVMDGATYAIGEVPSALCMTIDLASGVATTATPNVSGSNPDVQGIGQFVATCSGAVDQAGNAAAAVSVTYRVSPFVIFYAPQLIN